MLNPYEQQLLLQAARETYEASDEEAQWIEDQLGDEFEEQEPGFYVADFVENGLLCIVCIILDHERTFCTVTLGIYADEKNVENLNILSMMKNADAFVPGYHVITPGHDLAFVFSVPTLSPYLGAAVSDVLKEMRSSQGDYVDVCNGADPLKVQLGHCFTEALQRRINIRNNDDDTESEAF